ncbi:hypothetical protein J4463_00035 [Candidatus Pacearchaeota archaeon]|nr:hypothetical protein [Candidatus Pacearchaeota archaeon]
METSSYGQIKCDKCNGTGVVREKNGEIHTCWDCLEKGKLDVHSKSLPKNNIRL